MKNITIISHTCATSANVCWGLMAPISKAVILTGLITPIAITNLRITGSLILFWLLSFFLPKEKMPIQDHLKLAGASILGIIINQTCFISGLSYTSPTNASIITTSMPLWVMILSAFILKDPLTKRKLIGLGFGACGALSLVLSSATTKGESSNAILGDLLVMIAQMSYALYMVLYANFLRRYSIFTIMRFMYTYAFIIFMPLTFTKLIDTSFNELSILNYLGILYIIVIGTFLCQILLIIAQRALLPSIVGMYNYVQPIVASIISIVWGFDEFSFTKLFSIILIFTGVFIVSRSSKVRD